MNEIIKLIEKLASAVFKWAKFLDKNKDISEKKYSDNTTQAPAENTRKAPSKDIAASGSIPPKPCFTVSDEYGDKKYSFELSGDFIEFNSHCEFDPSYQYEPFSNEEYTDYDGNLPVVSIGPDDTIYSAAESYEKSGSVSGMGITVTKCSNPCFLFSTTFKSHDLINYAYAFAGGTAREYEMLCVQYSPAICGTALEKKLIAAVDHAADTYKESNLN